MTAAGDNPPSGSPSADDTTENAAAPNANTDDTTTAAAVTTSPTTTARAPSALHNRILTQQRSNIMLQVLFQHMLNNRRRRDEVTTLAQSSPPPLPDRVMPVLSHSEAVAMQAICRFCFEGSLLVDDQQQGGEDLVEGTERKGKSEEDTDISHTSTIVATLIHKNTLIAPCNCAGGSKWVHLNCLRQWQRMQARSLSNSDFDLDASTGSIVANQNHTTTTTTTYTAAGYTCNICNSPYLSRPPTVRGLRRNLLKRGTLLVAKANVGRTFQQSIVLLLSDISGSHGAFGLIINAPLHESAAPVGLFQASSSSSPSSSSSSQTTDPQEPQQENTDSNNSTLERIDNHGDHPNGNASASPSPSSPSVEWRRGGPVCGGRLGVVHYTILHTFSPTMIGGSDDDLQGDILDVDIDEDYFDEENEDAYNDEHSVGNDSVDTADIEITLSAATNVASTIGDDDDDDDAESHAPEERSQEGDVGFLRGDDETLTPLSLPVFDVARNTPPLQFLASVTAPLPSTFSEDKLEDTVKQLTTYHNYTVSADELPGEPCTTYTDQANQHAAIDTDTNQQDESEDNNDNKVIIFSGYCKWRAGQLEREIQREVWDVCVDATPADVFRHTGNGSFWEEMRESDRLLSWQRLVEEEDLLLEDDASE